jgi:hypothetical protein
MQLKNGEKLEVEKFRGVITHNDLDGILSCLCINQYLNIPLSGIFELHGSQYNYSKLITSEPMTYNNVNSFLYVDLSMKHKSITSIDHHGTIKNVYDNPNCINANRYYSKSYDMLEYGTVKHKNPTGCVHFLLYLLDIPMSTFTDEQKILLCLADGLHSVYHSYTSNVESWLNMWGMGELIDILKNTSYAQFQAMRDRIGIGASTYFNYDEVLGEYTWQNGRTLGSVADNISEIMDWKPIVIPPMKQILLHSNHTKPATRSNIDMIMNDDNVISVCVNKGNGEMGYSRFTGSTINL